MYIYIYIYILCICIVISSHVINMPTTNSLTLRPDARHGAPSAAWTSAARPRSPGSSAA